MSGRGFSRGRFRYLPNLVFVWGGGGQTDFIVIRYSATNDRLASNNRFHFLDTVRCSSVFGIPFSPFRSGLPSKFDFISCQRILDQSYMKSVYGMFLITVILMQ
jgi:hypothetical protein